MASKAASTSSCSRRENMNTRFPITMGVEYPSPTSAFHFIVSPSGHVAGAVKDCSAPSRLGPRHWGQSVVERWAPTTAVNPETTTAMIPTMCRDVMFLVLLWGDRATAQTTAERYRKAAVYLRVGE